ncbi:chemotaxis protein CheW [Natrinema caseinilyticum]|uniref:chemotaxis protein CheW n=1 Tax=Natrinema caseinilyticum TaxID=2961570 RepID=UPI0020C48F13|nr:chemotaxis protein CheW [Natrinema caseinilyticum]
MAPDLSEKLLGIDIDGAERTRDEVGGEREREDLVQFVFVRIGDHRLALPVDAVSTITEPPTSLTRVPRSPPAIEGLMDLRGEITAVVDTRVHFPVDEPRSEKERLLVLDRPGDQQSAAIRVDEVVGVETVPESDVIDSDGIESSEFAGDALEHPLVVALVTQEREQRIDVSDMVADGPEEERLESDTGVGTGIGVSTAMTSVRETAGRFGEPMGETFEIEPEVDDEPADDSPQEIVVEATALIDVDRLLLASGHA